MRKKRSCWKNIQAILGAKRKVNKVYLRTITRDVKNIRGLNIRHKSSVGEKSNNENKDVINNEKDNNTENKKIWLEWSQGEETIISIIDQTYLFIRMKTQL